MPFRNMKIERDQHSKYLPPVSLITLVGFGGWFVRFSLIGLGPSFYIGGEQITAFGQSVSPNPLLSSSPQVSTRNDWFVHVPISLFPYIGGEKASPNPTPDLSQVFKMKCRRIQGCDHF